MKILLVHRADFNTVLKVRSWKKNKYGIGEFYHLSLFENFSQLLNQKNAKSLKFFNKQVSAAVHIHQIERIVFLYEDNDRIQELLNYLQFKFPHVVLQAIS